VSAAIATLMAASLITQFGLWEGLFALFDNKIIFILIFVHGEVESEVQARGSIAKRYDLVCASRKHLDGHQTFISFNRMNKQWHSSIYPTRFLCGSSRTYRLNGKLTRSPV
jgi:hypothetical protein